MVSKQNTLVRAVEINCENNCGNLTDSPDSPLCAVCRELGDQRKRYKITWQSNKVEILLLTPYQANNLKETKFVKTVVQVG